MTRSRTFAGFRGGRGLVYNGAGSMGHETATGRTDELVRRLDEAVDTDCVHGRCDKVKAILEDVFRSGEPFLAPEFLEPDPERYARRLVHRDPAGRYSVVAMVWGKGQGTAIHDHAGQWCVECVYSGTISVTSYDLVSGDEEAGVVQFRQEKTVLAGVGEAGALIPPFEYHTIANALDGPTVTVHVYGEELTWCHVFQPVEGGYERVRRELSYTP